MENKYKTKQRKLIEEYLIKNIDRFVSSEEIYKYMKENNQNVGLTTIYRFLDFLEKNNNVRVDIKDHTKFYQYIKQNCNNQEKNKAEPANYGRLRFTICKFPL